MGLLVGSLAMDRPPLEQKATLLGVWEKGPGGNDRRGCIPQARGFPSMKAGDVRGGPARGG